MAKTRYKEYVEKMISENKELFDKFKALHDKYGLDEEKYQEEFNALGKKALEVVHEYENRVCANTERGMYNKFSGGLAEKFQNEVKKHFPLIDHVGLIVETPQPTKKRVFAIKKINLE